MTNVIEFKPKVVEEVYEEDEFVFSLDVFKDSKGFYEFQISEMEDEEMEDSQLSEILTRAAIVLGGKVDFTLEADDELIEALKKINDQTEGE